MDVNWSTGVITVYKTDSFMSLLGGSVYSMDTNQFRLALRDREDDVDGMAFLKTHDHNTQVTLGGIQYARVIEILSPYTITFDDTGGAWVCNLTGSNNNILDVTNLTSVQVRSNNSAGLINVVEIQQDIFQGAVWIDQANGQAGQLYPAGTPLQPVDNFADAVFIAASRGISTLHVQGNAAIGSGDNVSGYRIVGENAARTSLTIDAAATISNVDIQECSVTGTLDGNAILRTCYVTDITYFSGFIHECQISGTITLGNNAQANILSCYSADPNNNPPIIDFGGSGQSLVMGNWTGNVKLENKTGTDFAAISLNGGQVQIDLDTVTNGQIRVEGTGKVVDADDTTDYLPYGTYGSLVLDNDTSWGRQTAEIHQRMALDPDLPVTNKNDGSFDVGSIDVNATTSGTDIIQTRQ